MGFASLRLVARRSLALALLVVGGAACEIPRDAAGTTDRVVGGELRAGAVHDPPWVIATDGGEPRGIEPDLVRSFAASVGSRVVWVVGSEEQLVSALEHRALDLVVAGLPASSPHGERVGFITPYVELDVVVAARPGSGVDDLDERAVAVPAARPALEALVRGEDAEPRRGAAAWETEPLAVGYLPELEAVGRTEIVTVLAHEPHVMAVAPGESRFAARLEHHLGGARDHVVEALREAATRPGVAVVGVAREGAR